VGDEFKENAMRRAKVSTQAMFEFQRMIRAISDNLQLVRTGKFWELWFAGSDFGKSEAEIAKLYEEAEEGDYVYHSNKYGDIKITPKGAIRSLDFGSVYESLPVLAQLSKFLDRHMSDDNYIINLYLDLVPQGNMIDVDVKAVEDFSGYNGDNEFVEDTVTRTIATFTYDPTNNLLLHRTAK
jgi:hypothetical protein